MKTAKLFSIYILVALMIFSSVQFVYARPLQVYTPPSNITIRVYRLTATGARRVPYVQCTSGDKKFGCTNFCDESPLEYPCVGSPRAYPYATNPVTIPIETDYLLDVIPREISVAAFHPTSIQTQAIAARTFAYAHIRAGSQVNNSTEFQAFVPYAFEALNLTADPNNPSTPCSSTNLNSNQSKVCAGVTPRHYISYGPSDDLPVFSQYFADIKDRTNTGDYLYEIGVDDPVSSDPNILQSGHGWGMSQKGASRWAFGNLGFQGNLNPWSVKWDNANQILVHYYTGINIRDANKNNEPVITPYRWNPLQILGLPATIYHGQQYNVNIKVQNTSVNNWLCGYPIYDYRLMYTWTRSGHSEITGSNYVSMCNLTKGDPSPVYSLTVKNIPQWGPGSYRLHFDIYVASTQSSFWFSDAGWTSYDIGVCVDGQCKAYLPMTIK